MFWSLWLACVSDPEVDAWHGAIELSAARLAVDDCAGELVDADPVDPYLFLAVDRGVPDLASVYWCDGAEECDVPSGSVYVAELTVDHIAGSLAEPVVNIGFCNVYWFDLDATRAEGAAGAQVTMTYRAGRADADDLTPDECAEFGPSAIGVGCLEVWELEGVQVSD